MAPEDKAKKPVEEKDNKKVAPPSNNDYAILPDNPGQSGFAYPITNQAELNIACADIDKTPRYKKANTRARIEWIAKQKGLILPKGFLDRGYD